MSAEPLERVLARLEAAAALASWRCPHCNAALEALAATDGGQLVRAVGITHEEGCPDWVPDE